MSEYPHPGLHPDPDSLSAFIEGVLPKHERLQCLAHLAECSRCREVVFLAQEPRPAVAARNPVPAWRRWFAPVRVLAAGAAACIAVLAVSLYLHYTGGAPARDTVARVKQSPPAPEPRAVDTRTEAQMPSSVAPKATPKAQRSTKPEPDRAARGPATGKNSPSAARPTAVLPISRGTISATAQTTTTPSLLPPPPIPAQSDTIQNQQLPLPPALLSYIPLPPMPPSVDIGHDRGAADGLSGISGTVTDATGAAIPAATVTLRQLTGTFSSNSRTDVTGQFKLAGLPAGRYELRITAPGFRQTSWQIDLQPRELATVSPELAVGSVSETVEVTATASTIQTSSASVSSVTRRKTASPRGPRPLPSKLPATITAISGKVILAVDSAGALFRSGNAGEGWKAVKAVWRGKVVHLVTPAEPSSASTAVFQLTTDSDSAWLSRDGSHWYPAPAPR